MPLLPTFLEALPLLKQKLTTIYDDSEAEVIAERVLLEISSMSRSERICYPVKRFSREQWQQWLRYQKELLEHKPLQYILGKTSFYGLELEVNASVLIPRPETEELVDFCLKGIKSGDRQTLRILDIGTGSGCIALALKKYLSHSRVFAADFSEEALVTATKNAQQNRLNIDFLKWNILNEPPPNNVAPIDILISNPPYITSEEKSNIHANVLHYEPHSALFVTNNDPLQFYKKIESMSREILQPNGQVFLELHESFARQTSEYFLQKGWATVLKKDFQGKDRMLRASRMIN